MKKWRNIFITIFVILWCCAFHYESIRHFYLNPIFDRSLPKIKFLFPPAGWIMFFRVDESYGHLRIFGFKDEKIHEIDPHEIFKVRTIGFDNIHRGVIGSAASRRNRHAFCKHLFKHFDTFDNFRVVYSHYPNYVTNPYESFEQILYACRE